MTSRTTWKKCESRIAKDFDTKRNPLSGSMSGHSSSDSLSQTFYIESKLRVNPPGWTLFQDTKNKSKQEKKIPIVVLSKKYHKDKICMVDYDFMVSVLERVGFLKGLMEEKNEK